MNSLLSFLKGFIDLQKAASITVPGVVAAFALILFAWPTDSLVFQGYTFTTPPHVAVPAVCDALSKESATSSGSDGRVSAMDYSSLQARRWQIEDCERQLQTLLIQEQRTVAGLADRIDREQKHASEAQAKYIDYLDKFSTLAEKFKQDADKALATVETLKQDSKAGEIRAAFYTAMSARWAEEQKIIVDRLRAGNSGEIFADVINKIAQRALYFAILAITIGFVLDPINKTVFSNLYSTYSIRVLNAIGARLGTVVVPSTAKSRTQGRPSADILNVNYALGLKLISQDDVDALQNRYYYAAQMSVGLIIPTAMLLLAAVLFLNARYPDQFLRHIPTVSEIQRPADGAAR